MAGLIFGLFGAATTAGVVAAVRENRRESQAREVVRRLTHANPDLTCFYTGIGRSAVEVINGARTPRTRFVAALDPAQIAIYPLTPGDPPHVAFPPSDLRWFGRPKKYSPGTNEIWLHAEHEGQWLRFRLRLPRERMQALVRALKAIATPEQVTAYRRRRPYIHLGPVPARPATQDMLGAWTLGAARSLYLTPSHLVVLDGAAVERALPLEQVQKIGATRRLDQPDAGGLVRFEVAGDSLAFAVEDDVAFAEALAEAAKRTLEDPVQWQRKKKKADASGWDEDE